MTERAELICSQCRHSAVCGPGVMLDWLRKARRVRRTAEPAADLIAELFRIAAPEFTCPQCGAKGLLVRPVAEDDDEAWGGSRNCEDCGQPIARERVEMIPGVRLCAKCQASEERGAAAGSAEYCPRCGTPMVVRLSSAPGVTRYVTACPACRR